MEVRFSTSKNNRVPSVESPDTTKNRKLPSSQNTAMSNRQFSFKSHPQFKKHSSSFDASSSSCSSRRISNLPVSSSFDETTFPNTETSVATRRSVRKVIVSKLSHEKVPALLCSSLRNSIDGQKTQESLKSRVSSSSESEDEGLNTSNVKQDTRAHVIGELYDTEKNYVKKLNFLIKRYEQNLRSGEYSGIVDPTLLDHIFYQVPDILSHHERFLDGLRRRIDLKDASTCVGDVIFDLVSNPLVLTSYTSFTNNWKTAQDATKMATIAKPAFGDFLKAMAREHPGKMDLKSLLISPVQRFPHYEMLLKRLIKHTSPEHPDGPLLMEALATAQEVTVKINDSEKRALQQEHQQDILRDLESVIEGLEGLVQPDRTFLQCDLATMHSALGTRKERCMFLFSDILVITAIKRRSGTLRKGSSLPWALLSSLESSKLKLFKFIPLDDLDVTRSRDDTYKKLLKDIEGLERDLQTVKHMGALYRTLNTPRGGLEEALHEAETGVRKALSDRQGSDSPLNEIELTITTQEGVEAISFTFHSPDKRANWEEAFRGAKIKLNRRPPPEFVSAIPIRKTRAGLQFTCAASTLDGLTPHDYKDVWVCNSDGYVGQVCVLSLHPEPTVTCCNGVCNARILSIASVPSATPACELSGNSRKIRGASNTLRSKPDLSSRKRIPTTDGGLDLLMEKGRDSFKRFRSDGRQAVNKNRDSDSSCDEDYYDNSGDCLSGDENRKRRSESLPPTITDSFDCDAQQPTMWLGTEDGFIHVYSSTDSIRIKKNRFKFQLGSSVHCIIHLDDTVFASLASGEVVVYKRGETSWLKGDREIVPISTAAAPVTKMIVVAGRLWCSAGNAIKIVNINTMQLEHSFQVTPHADGGQKGGVSCMVSGGMGVWVAVAGSSILRWYHPNTHSCMCEADVSAPVTKMLASSPSCDEIIRQHKAACLRITALLACKDLLWIGTSAGVVLTTPLPHHHTSNHSQWRPHHHISPTSLNLQAVPYGHTGQVRFLTSVESSLESMKPPRVKTTNRHSAKGKQNQSTPLSSSHLFVISGGDGYEDFRNANMSEMAGRDDSTNHLIMWHV